MEKALTHGSETEILLVKKQVGERLIEYGQMQVVTTPAENPYLVYEKGTLLLLFNARLNDKKNGVFFQFLEILELVYFFIWNVFVERKNYCTDEFGTIWI